MFALLMVSAIAGASQIPFVWSTKWRRPMNVAALIVSLTAFMVVLPIFMLEVLTSAVIWTFIY